jgi:uncharacterized C2H2 Zn-finger protein
MFRNDNLIDLVFFRNVPLIRHVDASYLHRHFGTGRAEGKKVRKVERKNQGLEGLNT